MASKKQTVSVTVNGQTITKTTARSYSHAVVADCPDGVVRVLNWCGSYELAVKSLSHNRAIASIKGSIGQETWGGPENLSVVTIDQLRTPGVAWYADTAEVHKAADERCGRGWTCGCGACRTARDPQVQ